MLILPIKKKWFDMILSGEKKEEYRGIKSYWTKRFTNDLWKRKNHCYEYKFEAKEDIARQEYLILLKNGYSRNTETLLCNCLLRIRTRQRRMGSRTK